MARTALLDINVLVALFFPEHVHHELAHDWFADNATAGWATCPLTQNGFVRVAAQLRPGDTQVRPAVVAGHLGRFCQSPAHRFWPDSVSLLDAAVFQQDLLPGPRRLTDVYLLGLAVRNRGRLVTFDRGIPLGAVAGATEAHLHVVSPIANP